MRENIKTLIYAVLLALTIRTVAYEPFNIPSGSMLPTLLVGDYLFVNKRAFGYSRYSLPFNLPVIPASQRFLQTMPESGDIAVFKLPSDTSVDYIKRIIGLPGDRIQVRQGILYINDVAAKRERLSDYIAQAPDGKQVVLKQYLETLPNGVSHLILKASDDGPYNNTKEYVVPEGHLFAMGDNRDNSMDSRFEDRVGFVPIENLIGRASFLFFSTNGTGQWFEPWKWPATIRFDRLLHGVRH